MNINNRFLDESKIIKKKINEEDNIKEPIKEPIKETLSNEIKEQINKSVNEPIKKAAAKKEKAKKKYEELLKEVIEETPEVVPEQQKRNDIEIAVENKNIETKPTKKDKPIYQYGRDKNDNPVILNRGAEEVIQDKEPEYTNRTACIALKIRQTEKELINLSVDLDVYAKLLELYNSEPKKTIFTNRVKAITDDITVNEQKLKILKDLMQKLSN